MERFQTPVLRFVFHNWIWTIINKCKHLLMETKTKQSLQIQICCLICVTKESLPGLANCSTFEKFLVDVSQSKKLLLKLELLKSPQGKKNLNFLILFHIRGKFSNESHSCSHVLHSWDIICYHFPLLLVERITLIFYEM